MHTIHKQVLEIVHRQQIEVPRWSYIISIGEQNEKISLWYRCIPENDICKTNIFIVGTGHTINDGSRYVGTVQMKNGLVWHVFEEENDIVDSMLED